MTTSYSGGCLCGAIRFTVDGPITALRACHCTHCQKASGTWGGVNVPMPSERFHLLQGTPKMYRDKADSGRFLQRFFCGDCGSPLFSRREVAPEFTVVRAGAIEGLDDARITANIWTKSARPWAHIDPKADNHPAMPPA